MTREKCLYIELEDEKRYLANRSDVDIERLVYSTWTIYFNMPDEDDVTISSIPTFEILDIPGGSRVYLEDVDPYEGGMLMFEADEVVWADGKKHEKLKLEQRRRKRLEGTAYIDAKARFIQTGDERVLEDPEPPVETIEREKRLIKEEPSQTRYASDAG